MRLHKAVRLIKITDGNSFFSCCNLGICNGNSVHAMMYKSWYYVVMYYDAVSACGIMLNRIMSSAESYAIAPHFH